MTNNLLLLSGNDIPFAQARLIVHQPRIKELALLGENNFFKSSEMVIFSKDNLKEEDKKALENKTNFEIFMSIMNNFSLPESDRISVQLLFNLIFPKYDISFQKSCITCLSIEDENFKTQIDNTNFEDFKKIFKDIFCLGKRKRNSDSPDYDPANSHAAAIAAKINRGREIALKEKNGDIKNSNIGVFDRYISILSIGLQMDINELMNYTVYQLYDTFERFELKIAYDANFRARLAGAQDLEDEENWMKDIHNL